MPASTLPPTPPAPDAPYGAVTQCSPLIQRVLAPNPSPFTFTGTGVYIIGTHEVAVIDPGPVIPQHMDALRNALKNRTLRAVLVTHTHSDHSPAATPLAREFGAPVLAFGPHFDPMPPTPTKPTPSKKNPTATSPQTASSPTETASKDPTGPSNASTHPDTPQTTCASPSLRKTPSSPATMS